MPNQFHLFKKTVAIRETDAPTLTWEGDFKLRINEVNFRLSYDTNELLRESSNVDNFILGKPRHMVERAVDIAAHYHTRKVFEMGIFRGGSVVLYDQIFKPTRIVAIDHAPEPVKALSDYITCHDKSDVIRPYYGVSQADRSAMENLLTAEFAQRDIDIIIDDASHFYDETRAAFNICFPFLATNGLYVIEDWGWAHWSGGFWQGKDSPFEGKPALSNLLTELFMLSASRPDLIENLFIDHNMVIVRKGAGAITPGKFDIADHYLLRGKIFEPSL